MSVSLITRGVVFWWCLVPLYQPVYLLFNEFFVLFFTNISYVFGFRIIWQMFITSALCFPWRSKTARLRFRFGNICCVRKASICLPVRPSVCLSIWLCILSVSIYSFMFVCYCLSVCVYLSVCLSIYFFRLSTFLCIYPHVRARALLPTRCGGLSAICVRNIREWHYFFRTLYLAVIRSLSAVISKTDCRSRHRTEQKYRPRLPARHKPGSRIRCAYNESQHYKK